MKLIKLNIAHNLLLTRLPHLLSTFSALRFVVMYSFEFQFIIDKYFDQLILCLFVTKWLIDNLKKYNKDKIHLTLVGAFNLQYENFNAHLRDFYTNFGILLDLEKEQDFSTVNFVIVHVPEIISTYTKILNKISDESNVEVKIIIIKTT